MLKSFPLKTHYLFKDLRSVAFEILQSLRDKLSSGDNWDRILRYEIPCEYCDSFIWLYNQDCQKKVYWANRDKSLRMGGIGICDEICGDKQEELKTQFSYKLDHLSCDNPNLRYYGGLSFEKIIPEDNEWSAYKSYRFIIPQFEILNIKEGTYFVINIKSDNVNVKFLDNMQSYLLRMNFEKETDYRNAPNPINREDLPNKSQWEEVFKSLFNCDGSFKHKKIVLARRSIFDFDRAIKPEALLKHLADITPNCYHFSTQIDVFQGFLGASPEKLFSIEGHKITSEAIAGTIRRGKTVEEDKYLENKLVHCDKNREEHQFVIDIIDKSLRQLCQSLSYEAHPSVLKLKSNQHLKTRFEGELSEDVSLFDILSVLHPTPAVGGVSNRDVLKDIDALEPFTRGWYAAPFGCIGYNTAEFAVAIRSGLVDNKKLSLYAGAGLVKGSNLDDEWEEIETKIDNFIKVFGV